eukprot:gene5610-216_t
MAYAVRYAVFLDEEPAQLRWRAACVSGLADVLRLAEADSVHVCAYDEGRETRLPDEESLLQHLFQNDNAMLLLKP